MLESLHIRDLVLVEKGDIPFEKGFCVLSGETGSGKSAIMGALNLVLGGRSDANLIRSGCSKGSVEGVFSIKEESRIQIILEEAGIECNLSEELVIRRVVYANGRSRCWVNHQNAQLHLLKKLGAFLVDIVGQHANQKLLHLEFHREILDIYCGLEEDVIAFQQAWDREKQLQEERDQLVEEEAQRLREIEVCRMELTEIEEAALKEGEEEGLFVEYSRLVNAETLASLAGEVSGALSGGKKDSVLVRLNAQKVGLERLVGMDATLEETAKAYESALLELQEVDYTLRNYGRGVRYDPQRLEETNERLALINRLKRKYGVIEEYYANAKERLEKLENADVRLEELAKELQGAQEATQQRSQTLSERRREGAKEMQKRLTGELRFLNMPEASLEISVISMRRSSTGEDLVEFFLSPNRGEKQVSLRKGVSGGEIARVMLSIKKVLAGKEQVPTLVFDEIDASIGGETASIVGETFRAIGEKHQVLCITHFAQVASCAGSHLHIAKEQRKERTITSVDVITGEARQRELARMLGGDPFSVATHDLAEKVLTLD